MFAKKLFIFLLGILFGWASVFAWSYWVVTNSIWNHWVSSVNLSADGFIDSLKDSISSISISKEPEAQSSGRIQDIWDVLEREYFYEDDLNYDEMKEEAVRSFVEAIDDPYTVYLDSDENEALEEGLEWEENFEWIWAVVTNHSDGIMIEEVVKWSPAFESWLMPMDIIISVDWETTEDESLSEAVDRIRGEKWTIVTLEIIREEDGKEEVLEKDVERWEVSVPSVRWEIKTLDSGEEVWYIQISVFGEDTEEALQEYIEEYQDVDIDWIVLDLRWNWGGLLPMAVDISSYFIPEWETVVTAEYKNLPSDEHTSRGYNDFQDMPITVLVDEMSASASEIIAAALRDQIGAEVVGQETFGKWSIQTLHPFDDGASLKYTIWERLSPTWENYKEEGLVPEHEIEYDEEQYQDENIDNQLQKALEVLEDMIN